MQTKLLAVLFLFSVIVHAQDCSDTANHPPKAYFNQRIDALTCGGCGSGINVFTDSSVSAPDNKVIAWNWSFPGGTPSSSTQQHPVGITYPLVGNYTACLTVTSLNGCKDSTCKVFYNVCVSVNEMDIESLITVFPNPTAAKVNVQISELDNLQMSLFNIYGECILNQIYTPSHPQIDLSAQPGGVYFLKASIPNGVVVKKIVKE